MQKNKSGDPKVACCSRSQMRSLLLSLAAVVGDCAPKRECHQGDAQYESHHDDGKRDPRPPADREKTSRHADGEKHDPAPEPVTEDVLGMCEHGFSVSQPSPESHSLLLLSKKAQ